jgi:hypothetical protein
VNYDAQNWKLICDQLNADHEEIHVLNRAQIIDDVFQLGPRWHDGLQPLAGLHQLHVQGTGLRGLETGKQRIRLYWQYV